MRFFCTQPDIVEDVQAVRYHTKSSAGGVGSFLQPSSRSQTARTTGTITKPRKALPASRSGTVSEAGGRLNKSRTGISALSHGGKKLFGERNGSISTNTGIGNRNGTSVSVGGATISAPIPIENGIGKGVGSLTAPMGYLHVSPPPMIVHTGSGNAGTVGVSGIPQVVNGPVEMDRDKSKSLDIAVGSGMVTDSEREGNPKHLRRKSRRMSAPLAAFGINIGSGTDTDTTTKRKRVSKVMIGNPEGFKHEGHMGMGGAFVSNPEMPDSWNVEAWRAEIERTLSSAKTPPTLSRPKGPRPASTPSPILPTDNTAPPRNNPLTGNSTDVPPRNRHRRSVDGVAQRIPIDGYGGTSGAMTDSPTRPSTSPARRGSGSGSGHSPSRHRSGSGNGDSPLRKRSGSGGSPHRRSRSGSLSQSQSQTQPPVPGNYNSQTMGNLSSSGGRTRGTGHGHSSSQGNPSTANEQGRSQSNGFGHAHSLSQPNSYSHGHGHTFAKDSITSLASIPTSTSTSTAHTTILTPNTTSTSLSRSLSEKAYYSSHPHVNGNAAQYHQHLQHLGKQQPHNPPYHNGAGQFGMNNGPGGVGGLQRSSSATASLPPSSTASSATEASMTSGASSVTAYGGGGNGTGPGTGRKPIPAQRRKPVPQHLPATVEVSPFPSLFVVGSGAGAAKDGPDGKRAPFPFDINIKREALPDPGVDVVSPAKGTGAGDGPPVPTKREKELVPLLGVPGDDAHYVTKSTKARWDGTMAEIASALRDPNAEPPI